MLQKEQKKRRYVFSSKELKEKLGIEGEIYNIEMWAGRSPAEEEEGVSPDTDEWCIETKDGEFEP